MRKIKDFFAENRKAGRRFTKAYDRLTKALDSPHLAAKTLTPKRMDRLRVLFRNLKDECQEMEWLSLEEVTEGEP